MTTRLNQSVEAEILDELRELLDKVWIANVGDADIRQGKKVDVAINALRTPMIGWIVSVAIMGVPRSLLLEARFQIQVADGTIVVDRAEVDAWGILFRRAPLEENQEYRIVLLVS